MNSQPAIQLIANVVLLDPSNRVLLVRRDPDEDKWWLPGEDLEAYEHPDERVAEVIASLGVEVLKPSKLIFIESFKGRRGWHVMFNYIAEVSAFESLDSNAQWFESCELPPTKHGRWEQTTISKVLEQR